MDHSEDKFVAVTLGMIALSGMIFLGTHIRVAYVEKQVIKAQLAKLAEGVNSVRTVRAQLNDALGQRKQQVATASENEKQYAALFTELLNLAKVDPDAKAVTTKWKIQTEEPSEVSSAPTTSSGASAPESGANSAQDKNRAGMATPAPARTSAGGAAPKAK